MTKEELKNKYSAFIKEISEILGLDKPIDILKLCATTDLFFQPLEKHIEELKAQIEKMKCCSNCKHFNKEDDIECCWNCERQLVNSLDNLSREEIIKDEWEIKEK